MRSHEKVKNVWSRVIGGKGSNYRQMDDENGGDFNKINKTLPAKQQKLDASHPYETKKNVTKDVKKDKKKRKGWKRIRHAALMTCRYIGLGVSHMSPVSTYPAPDYNIDPVWWCNSMQGKRSNPPHWTTGIILNGW